MKTANLSLEILSDLKGDNEKTTVSAPIKDEELPEDNTLGFYSNTYKFSKNDFDAEETDEDEEEDEEEEEIEDKNNNKFFFKILLLIFGLLLAVLVIIYFIGYFHK